MHWFCPRQWHSYSLWLHVYFVEFEWNGTTFFETVHLSANLNDCNVKYEIAQSVLSSVHLKVLEI